MTTTTPSPPRDVPTDGTFVDLGQIMRRIEDAADAITSLKYPRNTERAMAAKGDLQAAVNAARDLGISWQSIGDVLGIRRGAAYQRYRRGRWNASIGARPTAARTR